MQDNAGDYANVTPNDITLFNTNNYTTVAPGVISAASNLDSSFTQITPYTIYFGWTNGQVSSLQLTAQQVLALDLNTRFNIGKTLAVNSTGTLGTVERFRVNTPTTVDNLANVMVATTATTSKGLVIQAKASQTANLQEWQSSTGTQIGAVDASGRFVANTLGSADNATYLCRNSSNQIATCSGTATGTAFVQGGNSFGSTATLGTNDTNTLVIRTNSVTRETYDTTNNVYFGNGITNASPAAFAINATGGSGTNIAGASLTLAGGQGTGTGVGGNIVFQYAPAGSTGAALNTLSTACTISGTNGSLSCPGTGSGSERFGSGSTAVGQWATSIGNGASAPTQDGVALGHSATGGLRGTALGASSTAGQDQIAIGQGASGGNSGNNVYAIVIGNAASINNSSQNSIAIGANATINANQNSIVLGKYATSTAANQMVIGGNNGGTSYGISSLYLGSGVTDSIPVSTTINATGGSGTNIAGASLTLAGGKGTGTGVGGNIVFQYAPAGSTGAALNTLSTACTISGTNGSLSCLGSGTNSERFGAGATATGTNCVAVGQAATAGSGADCVALGYAANTGGFSNSIAIGRSAAATAANQLVIGSSSAGVFSAFFGNGVTAASPQGFTLNSTGGSGTDIAGASLTLAGGRGTGTGVGGNIVFQYAPAGSTGAALNTLSTACTLSGTNGSFGCAGTSGTNSQRFGSSSVATGNNSLAIGNGAQTTADATVALGQGATATSSEAIALGKGATSAYSSSIAIGALSTTTAANQLVVGSSTKSIQTVYFGNGVTNATPTGFTLNATGGSGTNIAGASLTIAGGIGTGTGNGGSINLQVAKPGITGSSANSLATVATVSGVDGSTVLQNATNGTSAFIVKDSAGTNNVLRADTTNDRVGIGTGTGAPAYTLDVLSADADATTVAQFKNAGATSCTVQPGGTGFACSSDARLKTNVLTLNNSSDIVNKLRGVSFNWLSNPTGQIQSGFIAQELMQVIPGAVSQDSNGFYVANYSAIVPYLVNAFQDSDKRLTTLEAKVNDIQLSQGVFNGGIVTGDTVFQAKATFDGVASFKGQTVFAGGATFEGVTNVKGRLQLSNNNTGVATIPNGGNSVHVALPSTFSAAPNINLTPQDFVTGQYRVTHVTTTGFDIETSASQSENITFYWQAF